MADPGRSSSLRGLRHVLAPAAEGGQVRALPRAGTPTVRPRLLPADCPALARDGGRRLEQHEVRAPSRARAGR
eukprot:10835984-Alexandrium_andersonii.AAC.1